MSAASDAPEKPAAAMDFTAWMAELDALQDLRFRDPAAALLTLAERRGGWPPLAAAEDTLLHARCALQAGASHLVLGHHGPARAEFEALEALLARPELQAAALDLRHQAQRCGIAGKNAVAVLAHALGDFAGASRAYLGALALARTLGDRRYEAHVRVNLANTYEESGLPAESLEHSRLALVLAEQLQMARLSWWATSTTTSATRWRPAATTRPAWLRTVARCRPGPR